MNLNAPVGTVFRKCVRMDKAVCNKQTDGYCYCEKAFCHLHMADHVRGCDVAQTALAKEA